MQTRPTAKTHSRFLCHSSESWNPVRHVYTANRCCYPADAGCWIPACAGMTRMECDGGQHGIQIEKDAARTQFLEKVGYKVLRFWNNDILENMYGVLTVINQHLPESAVVTPHPNLLPVQRGEGIQRVCPLP